MSDRRVAITGIGVLSPVGNELEQFWDSLVEGKSGIGHITNIDASNFACRIGGEITDFDPKIYFKRMK